MSHTAGKNPHLPILSHVLLKTDEGSLKVSTTNLEMSISALVRGRVEAPGEFTVPAKLFQDYINLLSAGKIELQVQGDVLLIQADGKTTKIKGIPSTEFPLIPKLAKEVSYRLEPDVLKTTISQVAFAVSVSESRPELSGVACFFQGEVSGHDRAVFAATDSYRLSERVLTLLPGSSAQATKCIIPSRAMLEVARILASYKDNVAVPEFAEWSMAENQFVFTFGNVELVSRVIDGSFPDYRQIIPTQFRSVAVISRGELMKAIRAASLFSRQGLNDVYLEVRPESGQMVVTSADAGMGTHTAELGAEATGETNKVTLNYRYVMDGLAAMATDRVRFQMIDAMNPVLLTPMDSEGFQYIAMPIRQ